MTPEETVKNKMTCLLDKYHALGIAASRDDEAYEQYEDLLTQLALVELRQEGIVTD